MAGLRLHLPQPWPGVGDLLRFCGDDLRHIQVLKMQAGDEVELFDGVSQAAAATLVAVGKRQAEARVTRIESREETPVLAITVVQALPNTADKMDTVIQKCTELGVSRFVPLVTSRSAPALAGERLLRKMAHWEKVALEACRQCNRVRAPLVSAPVKVEDFGDPGSDTLKIVLHTAPGGLPLAEVFATREVAALWIAVGPEGGFAPGEVTLLQSLGFLEVWLGPRVLRTETAAPAVTAVAQFAMGEFR